MSSERVAHLRIELIKDGARSSKIFARHTIKIGRGAQSDLQIDDPSMSREHLIIEFRDGKIFATDLGSSNGTLLNHARLTPKKPTVVPEGATLRPGSAKIKINISVVEVRGLDDVDAELEHITMTLEDLAKDGVDKIRAIQSHEESLEKSVRAKQEKLVQLVDKLEVQATRKEEIEVALKSLEPKLARVTALLKEQEPRLRKFWELRKKQIRYFRNRREILFELGEKIDELEINIENHGLTEKRDELIHEVNRLTASVESLRRTEEKTRSDVESQLRLLDMRKQTEEAELQLIKARIQKEIEETESRKTSAAAELFELQRELKGISKQLDDVRDNLANELAATEKAENKRSSLEVHIEELQRARDALARSIGKLGEEDSELAKKTSQKRSEVKELEDFIVNRLAETDERCAQLEKESRAELDRELEETGRMAREHLESELARKRSETEADLSAKRSETESELEEKRTRVFEELDAREKDVAERVEKMETMLQEQSNAFEEKMLSEEKRRKKELELQLQEMRVRHETLLEDKEKESIQRQTKQLERQLRSISASALTTAALYIKSTTPNAATLLSSPELEEEVFTGLKELVAPAKSNKDGKPVLARAADLDDRERRFWIRTTAAAFALITIVTTLIINPRWPGQMFRGIVSYVENQETSGDYFAAKLEMERLNRPKYLPEQNREYRETYTDNMLYAEGFALLKLDEKIRKEWTLRLNDFLIKEFEVDEDVVVRFLPVETRLMNDLMTEMRNISPNFVDDGIKKMRDLEQSYKIELESILGGADNMKRFWDFQGDFYREMVKSLSVRVPAENKSSN